MWDSKHISAAALAFLLGVAFAATGAIAQTSPQAGSQPPQTGNPTQSNPLSPGPASGVAVQGQVDANPDQAQAFFKSLEKMVIQTLPGFQPSVGAPVPQDIRTNPMPPAAAEALPQVKDHHFARTDDDTIVIVDPLTRQVVGVISVDDDDDDDKPGAAPAKAAPIPGTSK